MLEKVIFDCDNTLGLPLKEIDDGLVILYLLGRPEIELLGITTTFGNGSAVETYQQTKKLLASLGREDIPIFSGAASAADASHADIPTTPAARYLAETSARFPGKVTLLATAPLGNLAAAARLNPQFFSQLKRLLIMGGNLGPPKIGWRRLPDLNFHLDPQAAFEALQATCETHLFHMNLCTQAAFTRRDLMRIRNWPPELRRIINFWLLAFGAYCGVGKFYLWDLLPAIYLSHPELFDTLHCKINSSLQDLRTGLLLTEPTASQSSIHLPSKILDPERLKDILFDTWSKTLTSWK
jgi:purine nucleosidase